MARISKLLTKPLTSARLTQSRRLPYLTLHGDCTSTRRVPYLTPHGDCTNARAHSAGTVNNLPSAYPHARAAAAAHAGKAPIAHHAATARTAHGLRCALERLPRRRCGHPRPCAPCCTMLPLAPGLTATLNQTVRGETSGQLQSPVSS